MGCRGPILEFAEHPHLSLITFKAGGTHCLREPLPIL